MEREFLLVPRGKNLLRCHNYKFLLLLYGQRIHNLLMVIWPNSDHHFCYAPLLHCLYLVDIDAPIVWKRIYANVRCSSMKSDYSRLHYVLDLVLQVNIVLGMMSNIIE